MSKPEHPASSRLGETLADLAEADLPADVMAMAKSRLIDALSVSYRGTDLAATRVAIEAVAGSTGPSTLLANGTPVRAGDAAFANGVMGSTTLQEDFGGGSHPGSYVIPASLAVAEERQSSGKRLLNSIVVGYEAAARVSAATPSTMRGRGFREVPTIGPFGAAAAAGAVIGLDWSRFGAALDVAGNLSGGLYRGFAAGTMEAYFHAGIAASGGVLAARLAEAGAVTAAGSLEGSYGFFATFGGQQGDLEALEGDRETEPAIMSANRKPFPACGLNQETMVLLSRLGPRHVSAGAIERVVIRRPAEWCLSSIDAPGVDADPPYRNALQAQMSAKFTAIATLLGRPVHDLGYFLESSDDPEVAAVAWRTDLIAEDRGDVSVEVHLGDGRVETRSSGLIDEWPTVREEAFTPTMDAMRQKLAILAAGALGDRLQPLLDVVERLDGLPDVAELSTLLRTPRADRPG